MVQETLFIEQRDYLRSKKDEMFSFLKGIKLGFDLNFIYYFGYLSEFELKKKYSTISEEIKTERFIIDEYGDLMDSVISRNGDSFSLKNSLKAEARFSVISHYIRSTYGKKTYPSQVRAKEQVIENALKRAHKTIDEYFKEQEVNYRDISDIIDIYELIVRENGKIVHLHFGRNGFSLNPETSSKEILNYVSEERIQLQEKQVLAREKTLEINQLKEAILGSFEEDEMIIRLLGNVYTISDYDILANSKEKLLSRFEKEKNVLLETKLFLETLKQKNISLPENTTFNLSNTSVSIDYVTFNYKKESIEVLKNHLEHYNKVKHFVSHIESEFSDKELFPTVTLKNDLMVFKVSLKNRIFDMLEGRVNREGPRQPHHVQLVLYFKDGKLYRETGEEVLTPEVVSFELMEKVRNIDATHLKSVEAAKEMLFSVLTEEQEEMFVEENIAILEGEDNYYALLNKQTYNNVIKIPKIIQETSDIRALCIHPEDTRVPLYDGFAAIALSVKSGDEEYVLQNSNEFGISKKVREQVMKVFNSFLDNQTPMIQGV